jgi:hypothetical protein
MNVRLLAGRAIALALATPVALAAASASAAVLCNNTNTGGVSNAPHSSGTPCVLHGPAHITSLYTYHWNFGHGAKPGKIGFVNPATGAKFGPFAAVGSPGSGGAPNVNWTASVSFDAPAGTWMVVDTDPATWSWDAASGGYGFARVEGTSTGAPAGKGPPPKFTPPKFTPPPKSTPGGGSVLTHTPCHANSATYMELAKPVCFGPPGTVLTLYVSKSGLKAPLTGVLFRSGPGYNHISSMLGGSMSTPGLPAVFGAAVTKTSGTGTSPDSTYTFKIPPGTCFSGKSHTWWFDIWLVGGGGGDVDAVAVKC